MPNDEVSMAITIPKRAHDILILEAERRGTTYGTKKTRRKSVPRGSMKRFLVRYAEELRNSAPLFRVHRPPRVAKRHTRMWRGPHKSFVVSVPEWVMKTLRERARRDGFIWKEDPVEGGIGSISALLQEYRVRYWRIIEQPQPRHMKRRSSSAV